MVPKKTFSELDSAFPKNFSITEAIFMDILKKEMRLYALPPTND